MSGSSVGRALLVGALALAGLGVVESAAQAVVVDRCGRADHCTPPGGDPGHWPPHGDDGGEHGYPDGPAVDDGDASTDSADCDPGHSCSVSPPAGADSRFRIDAAGGERRAQLFGTTNGGSRPDCPDYTERNTDWVQFGFTSPRAGAGWSKTLSMTQRQTMGRGDAARLADAMQICFAAPYSFRTRSGYELGRDGSDYLGVLPDCASSTGPCLSRRRVVRAGDGWTVRLTFRIPANALDPKALG
jgi:hypothetical protein